MQKWILFNFTDLPVCGRVTMTQSGVLKMARDGLAFELGNALHKVKKKKRFETGIQI
jgi:hypothetical protein